MKLSIKTSLIFFVPRFRDILSFSTNFPYKCIYKKKSIKNHLVQRIEYKHDERTLDMTETVSNTFKVPTIDRVSHEWHVFDFIV